MTPNHNNHFFIFYFNNYNPACFILFVERLTFIYALRNGYHEIQYEVVFAFQFALGKDMTLSLPASKINSETD